MKHVSVTSELKEDFWQVRGIRTLEGGRDK